MRNKLSDLMNRVSELEEEMIQGLQGQDLSGQDFKEWDLRNTDLSEANLQNANLREAILIKANLQNADLKGLISQTLIFIELTSEKPKLTILR